MLVAIVLTWEETRALRAHWQSPTPEGGELAGRITERLVRAREALGDDPAIAGLDAGGRICPIDVEVLRQGTVS